MENPRFVSQNDAFFVSVGDTGIRRDLPSSTHGKELKKAVRDFRRTQRAVTTRFTAHIPLFDTFAKHLDALADSVWAEPRRITQIPSFYPSASAALQRAHLLTDGQLVPLSAFGTQDNCWAVIKQVLDDPIKNALFYEGMWHPPVTIAFERGTPLQYVLRSNFPDREITILDLGEGPGIIVPLLMSNSPRYTACEFPGSDDLLSKFRNQVENTIPFGLGVDIHNRDESHLWARVNPGSWAGRPGEFEKITQEIEPIRRTKRYPHLTQDLTKTDTVAKIQNALRENNQEPTVACALSIFSGYQFLTDAPAQESFKKSITTLLQEGGIWIDIGEEAMSPDSNLKMYDRFKVNVRKKINGRLTDPLVPFIINEPGDILQTFPDYFDTQ